MEKDLQIMLNAFPSELEHEINTIFERVSFKTKLYNGGYFNILVGDELISIPQRIYYEDIKGNIEEKLSQVQRQILNCYLTRHHNGYIRQEKLNKLFDSGIIYSWSIPYMIRLMGEYVVEILYDIHKNIKLFDERELKEFIINNQDFIAVTEDRILSYWNVYYRRTYTKDEYVGFELRKYIQLLRKSI